MNATMAADRTTRTFRLSYDGDARRFSETEWLLSNGRGAFAMGTALGLNARRYHGLLIASLLPPVQRVMLLNGLVEAVTIDPGGRQEQTVEISNHQFADGAIHPRGLDHLKRFEKDLAVRWHYQIGEVRLSREVYLFDDRDEVAIRYRIDSAKHPVRLRVHPLMSLRDFHNLLHWVPTDHFQVTSGKNFVQVATKECNAVLMTKQGRFTTQRDWWHNFRYDRETDRGLEDAENLFTPGHFDLLYEPGDSGELRLDVGTGSDLLRDVEASQKRRAGHLGRIRTHIEKQGIHDQAVLQVAEATDDFIVLRNVQGEPSTSILAGYPWFSDWGRDTMICLPGLLQATGRQREALQTLNTYGKHVRRGLVPNRFDDYGGEPHYNTVDASLWYIHAAALYLHQTNDWEGFAEHALPACLQIVDHYRDGTDFDIGMDAQDKLIFAGNPDTQLTWMDAKRDGVVFTPPARQGGGDQRPVAPCPGVAGHDPEGSRSGTRSAAGRLGGRGRRLLPQVFLERRPGLSLRLPGARGRGLASGGGDSAEPALGGEPLQLAAAHRSTAGGRRCLRGTPLHADGHAHAQPE